MKWVFKLCIATSILIAIFIYAQFGKFSETEMINLSFGWLPSLLFGIIGQTIFKQNLKEGKQEAFNQAAVRSSIYTLLIIIGLYAFYIFIWPSL